MNAQEHTVLTKTSLPIEAILNGINNTIGLDTIVSSDITIHVQGNQARYGSYFGGLYPGREVTPRVLTRVVAEIHAELQQPLKQHTVSAKTQHELQLSLYKELNAVYPSTQTPDSN